MDVELSRKDLRSLRAKYERMLLLRAAARDARAARADATVAEPDPKAEMAQLAEEFPGSLRELDALPFATMRERVAALLLAEEDLERAEPWMRAQALFHRLARGALVTKRWLAGRKRITAATREAFIEALPELSRRADAELYVDDLAAVASPPRGRVMDLVHVRVAEQLGISEPQARALTAPRASLRRR